MNRKTLREINDRLGRLDILKALLDRREHYVTITGNNRDHDGHVDNTVRISLDLEEVMPVIKNRIEVLEKELKELGYEADDA